MCQRNYECFDIPHIKNIGTADQSNQNGFIVIYEAADKPLFGEKMFLVILAVVCVRDAVVVICHYRNMNVFF